jgi:hypothetical protein
MRINRIEIPVVGPNEFVSTIIVIPAEAGIQKYQQHGFPLPRE